MLWHSLPCMEFLFFELLAKTVGKYICVDEKTLKRECMDVARIMVQTNCAVVLTENFKV